MGEEVQLKLSFQHHGSPQYHHHPHHHHHHHHHHQPHHHHHHLNVQNSEIATLRAVVVGNQTRRRGSCVDVLDRPWIIIMIMTNDQYD